MNALDLMDDEFALTQAQIIQRRDEKIARLERTLQFATDEIEQMRKDMAASLPDVSAYISAEPALMHCDEIVIDGPRRFISLAPLWRIPPADRPEARHMILSEAAQMHLEAVYSKLLDHSPA